MTNQIFVLLRASSRPFPLAISKSLNPKKTGSLAGTGLVNSIGKHEAAYYTVPKIVCPSERKSLAASIKRSAMFFSAFFKYPRGS